MAFQYIRAFPVSGVQSKQAALTLEIAWLSVNKNRGNYGINACRVTTGIRSCISGGNPPADGALRTEDCVATLQHARGNDMDMPPETGRAHLFHRVVWYGFTHGGQSLGVRSLFCLLPLSLLSRQSLHLAKLHLPQVQPHRRMGR